MEYILIGILAAVVWGVRQTAMDLYDRVYKIEQKVFKDKDESI